MLKKKALLIIILIFVITIIVYESLNYFVIPKISFNKFVLDHIKEKYNDYESYKYIETYKCRSEGGVWFPHDIDNCYVSKYEIITKKSKFNIYVTNDHHSRIYIYFADSEKCLLHEFYEDNYSQLVSDSKECVLNIK